MFSFERSGVGVTGAGLGAGFCASAWLQLINRMASITKANPVFFMVAVLLEVRTFCAFTYPDTATTRLVRICDRGLLSRAFNRGEERLWDRTVSLAGQESRLPRRRRCCRTCRRTPT